MKPSIERRARRARARVKKIERAIKCFGLIAVVAFGSLVSVGFLKKAARPFLLYVQESQENRRIEKQIAELRSENSTLRQRITYIKTPPGAEAEARALGWVREGEVSLVIVPQEE